MSKGDKGHFLIVCLAGGVRSEGIPLYVADRVKKGVEIAKEATGSILLFSSSFTLNKPPLLNLAGIPVSEASAMANYSDLIGYQGAVFCEQQSHDTIGSAYFIFSDFVSFIDPRAILVVTSDFHVDRAAIIFRHVADLCGYQKALDFISVKSSIAGARAEKELAAAHVYRQEWLKISELSEFRRKLFSQHSNYDRRFSSNNLNSEALDSY